MTEDLDAAVVYRQFWMSGSHVAPLPDGRVRLKSEVFSTDVLCVDDGALTSPEDTARRCTVQPCGVVAVPKAMFAQLGLTIVPRPEPGNPAHCEVERVRGGKAKQLRAAAVLIVPLPGVAVVV